MNILPCMEASKDSMRARRGIRLDFLNALRVGSPRQSVVEMFEAVAARHVVLKFHSVAVEHLFCLKKFRLAHKYLKHVPTARPAHEIEVDFGKDGPHTIGAVSNVSSHLVLGRTRPRFRNLRS